MKTDLCLHKQISEKYVDTLILDSFLSGISSHRFCEILCEFCGYIKFHAVIGIFKLYNYYCYIHLCCWMTGGSLIKLAYVDKSQETREVGIFIFHIHVYIFINISNCTSVKLAAYPQSKNTCKKLESSPTTHVTETSFLHVLDPPDHFGAIYIFDHFFTYIHNLDFFSTNFP